MDLYNGHTEFLRDIQACLRAAKQKTSHMGIRGKNFPQYIGPDQIVFFRNSLAISSPINARLWHPEEKYFKSINNFLLLLAIVFSNLHQLSIKTLGQ
jgi:hypothetical protein